MLVGDKILEWLAKPWSDRLVVTPLLSPGQKLDKTSVGIDLRLGQQFLVMEAAGVRTVDPLGDDFKAQVHRSQRRVHVSIGQAFVLHPGRFALGATLEYVRLPKGLAAYVIGRSSWARVGLVIAMATAVHPGFAGVLTLELQNLGDVPLSLYPGSRIAQLLFHETKGYEQLGKLPFGAYSCQTEPGQTALKEDLEWMVIKGIRDKRPGTQDAE